jgi:hypothetical protein
MGVPHNPGNRVPRCTASHPGFYLLISSPDHDLLIPASSKDLKRQIYLGDERFVAQMQARLQGDSRDVNIPRVQRRPPAPALTVIEAEHTDRNAAMIVAYQTGEYSYHRIAEHFGVHFTTVGRIMRATKKVKAGVAHSRP